MYVVTYLLQVTLFLLEELLARLDKRLKDGATICCEQDRTGGRRRTRRSSERSIPRDALNMRNGSGRATQVLLSTSRSK